MGIWRIWELQLDRMQTQQDAVDVDSKMGGKVLKLKREVLDLLNVSLENVEREW